MAAPSAPTQRRDVVTIGCSAGGLEALGRIVQKLPADLRASVVIVQHIAPSPTPHLVTLLQRSSSLPIRWVEQGAPVVPAHIYVAPPDAHVLFEDDHFTLSRAPRENHARPSIDKLFRSAAATHGSRVIGALLTGMMHDGVAGLRAIQEAGGHTIVQDPNDAAYPELPGHALSVMRPNRVLRVEQIGPTIAALAEDPVPPLPIPDKLRLEAELDAGGPVEPELLAKLGSQTPVSCPDCGGPTWQIHDEHPPRLRCYLGHANTALDVLKAGSEQVETALWTAIRALSDRAVIFDMLAADAKAMGQDHAADAYAGRAAEARRNSEVARAFMLDTTRRLDRVT